MMGRRGQHDGPPFSRAIALCAGVVGLGAPVAAQEPTAFWLLSLSGQERWYSNADFTGTSPAVLHSLGSVGLAYNRDSDRGHLLASADSGLSLDNQQGINRIYCSANLDWTRELGPHTTLRLRDAVSQDYAQSTPELVLSGLVYPYTVIRSNSSMVSVSRQLSSRSSISVSGDYYWVDFPDSSLVSGQQASGTLDWGRTLGERDQLDLFYSYRWSDTQGPIYETHSLSASWSRRLGEATSGTVSAGVSRWASPSDGLSRYLLDARGSLRGHVRSTTYELAYSRAAHQVYGLGRERTANIVRMNLTRPLSRTLSASVSGARTWGTDLVDPTLHYGNQLVSATLHLQLRPRVGFGLGYDWVRAFSTANVQDSHSLYAIASYGWEWQ